jgi:hypothetical protein
VVAVAVAAVVALWPPQDVIISPVNASRTVDSRCMDFFILLCFYLFNNDVECKVLILIALYGVG